MTNPLGITNQEPVREDPTAPHVRILVCHVCQSVEELPDYDGPPEYDQILEYKTRPHRFGSGTPHKGILVRVPTKRWSSKEFQDTFVDELEEMVRTGRGSDMSEPLFYDIKQNFKEEAMQCWKEHRRVTDCGDYQRKDKALYADTKSDRKEAGMDISLTARPKHFLCDYCPVQSSKDQLKRAAAGLYDKQPWE